MSVINIQVKWVEELPTNVIRVGRTKFKNPGTYARVTLSGTNRQVGIFEVDAVDNSFSDGRDLHDYVELHPNVGEAMGYEPNFDHLIRKSTNLQVETQVPFTEIPACSRIRIDAQNHNKELIEAYLKNKNFLAKPITERVSVQDIAEHTAGSFDYSEGEMVSFDVLGTSPHRSTVVVRESTSVEFVDGSSSKRAPQPTPGDQGTDDQSHDRSGASAESHSGGQEGSTTFDESEVGEGFHISPKPPEHTFDDIVGLETVKERIEALTALTDDDFVRQLKSHYGNGIEEFIPEGYTMLLYGPPGCGKTMVAHGIANRFQKAFDQQSGPSFISIKGSDILASYKGQSESRVEATFAKARQEAAEAGYAILFFDEIETLIPDRNSRSTEAHDSRLTVAFLQEMNSIGDNVMVIGATNLPFTIDSAASRRFKTKLFVEHPGEKALEELWRQNLEPLNTKGSIDYQRLGEASTNFTPSEIDAMLETEVQSDIVEGMLENDPEDLTTEYFERKLEEANPRIIEEYISSVDQPDLFAQDQMQGYRELEEYIEEQKAQFEKLD